MKFAEPEKQVVNFRIRHHLVSVPPPAPEKSAIGESTEQHRPKKAAAIAAGGIDVEFAIVMEW